MKTVDELIKENPDNYGYPLEYGHSDIQVMPLELIPELAETYADQFKTKWISVEDRLPNNFEAVLLWADYIGTGHMAEINTIGTWQKDHWTTDRDNDYDKVEIHVTHWMPLPNNRPE